MNAGRSQSAACGWVGFGGDVSCSILRATVRTGRSHRSQGGCAPQEGLHSSVWHPQEGLHSSVFSVP